MLDWRDDLTVVTHSYPLSQQILRTDVSGMPLEWVDYREAARLYHTEQVAYTCGTLLYRLYGGTCARTGLRTIVDVNSIIATLGDFGQSGKPARRCLYAAAQQSDAVPARRVSVPVLRRAVYLQSAVAGPRDALQPRAATIPGAMSCRHAAAATTPRLRARPSRQACSCLAVPFTPTYAEYIFLKGRRVLADQMEYLIAHFPRSSPLHERMQRWPM